ncbi:hypothetical protein ACTXT7_014094 [Hymenolepis weldensis]
MLSEAPKGARKPVAQMYLQKYLLRSVPKLKAMTSEYEEQRGNPLRKGIRIRSTNSTGLAGRDGKHEIAPGGPYCEFAVANGKCGGKVADMLTNEVKDYGFNAHTVGGMANRTG